MRLGLIGTGKQGQRYLQERNGGASIVSTYDRHAEGLVDWLAEDRIDAVIVAAHPSSHFELVTHLLELRRPVLCEKPLALNYWECERLCDLALKKQTPLEVAHTHLWSEQWISLPKCRSGPTVALEPANATLVYDESMHDYSPWIDWAPHALALLDDTGAAETHLSFGHGPERKLHVSWTARGKRWNYVAGFGNSKQTPMWHMVDSFKALARKRNNFEGRISFNRRVYRALFAQENHGTT